MEQSTALNKVIIRGTITGTRKGKDNKAIYTIGTDGDKNHSFYPEVIHSVRRSDSIHRIGEHITAICHVRSGFAKDDENKKIYYKQLIVDSITPTERMLSEYIDGLPQEGAYQNDINECIFSGEVYSKYVKNEKQVMITLKIPEDEKYSSFVEVIGFDKQAAVMRSAATGDFLAVVCSVRTLPRTKPYEPGKSRFDFIAKDVCLLPADRNEED